MPTPETKLLGSEVFEEQGTATAVLTDLYSRMRDNGMLSGSYNNYPGLCGDELVDLSPWVAEGSGAFYNNSLLPTNSFISTFWNNAYNQIYTANSILEGVAGSKNLSLDIRQQFRGEALFIRAFLHFYLTIQFGALPYVDTTDYITNKSLSRISQEKVYQRIISDLNEAVTLLPETYITTDRARVNKWVAKAMLARVYLYHKDWALASSLATEVIEQKTLYKLEDDLDNVFLKSSKETIWHFDPGVVGLNTQEGAAAILYYDPTGGGKILSDQLMAAFETGDKRRQSWIGSYSSGGSTWYYSYKYKQRSQTAVSLEFSVILRLAELYLIRAEAFANLQMTDKAIADINTIRNRAGLQGINAPSADELQDAILHERQVELFYEFSHRWYDLVRTNKADQVLAHIKPGWKATDTLLPIPQSELLSNPNLLPQNPGY